MSKARRAHQGKTPAERKAYLRTQIRGEGDTIEDAPIMDTTDTPVQLDSSAVRPVSATRKAPWLLDFLREDLFKVMAPAAILVTLLGWGAYEVYTLNREVGELKKEQEAVAARIDGVRSEVEKTEARVGHSLDGVSGDLAKLDERIDRLVDSRLIGPTQQGATPGDGR